MYNDTADHLINNIISHFEFFSLFENDNDCVVANYQEFLKNYDPSKKYPDIPFIEQITQVYETTRTNLTDSVNHYILDFSETYPPKEYCETSGFAVGNTFFFGITISRHITYIDQFRRYVLNEKITNQKEIVHELKVQINKELVSILEMYINLFINLKKKITDEELEASRSLIDTERSFDKLHKIILKIRDSDYEDFETPLS